MSPTIMLVDPNAASRQDWEALLRDQGYAVIALATGEDLLALCPFVRPDLILINALPPGISAPELSRRLGCDPRNRLIFVISIAGEAVVPKNSTNTELPKSGSDEAWSGAPTHGGVLNRIRTILHIQAYTDEQTVSVITSLARSIEGRDPFTSGHSERLSVLVQRFGISLDMSKGDLAALHVAALIHDAGKVMLPDSILLKAGPLTSEESTIMRRHPV